jgi:predicted nucleic acid-binding Zn ribbon protein
MKHDLARELYKTWRNNSKRSKNNPTDEVRERVEDPQKLNTVLNALITARDWKQGIAEGTLFTDWIKVVGDEVAQHATPITLIDGLLTIQTSSTAWATQLTLVADNLLTTIQNDPSGATIQKLRFIGPQAPSWKKGVRTIRNARGVRDTYG